MWNYRIWLLLGTVCGLYVVLFGYFAFYGNSIFTLFITVVAVAAIFLVLKSKGVDNARIQEATTAKRAGQITAKQKMRTFGIALCIVGGSWGFVAMRFVDMSTTLGILVSIGLACAIVAFGAGCLLFAMASEDWQNFRRHD